MKTFTKHKDDRKQLMRSTHVSKVVRLQIYILNTKREIRALDITIGQIAFSCRVIHWNIIHTVYTHIYTYSIVLDLLLRVYCTSQDPVGP